MAVLGAKMPDAAPPWPFQVEPIVVAAAPVGSLVPEAVRLAVDMVGMEVLPRYGLWAPQGWSALARQC